MRWRERESLHIVGRKERQLCNQARGVFLIFDSTF